MNIFSFCISADIFKFSRAINERLIIIFSIRPVFAYKAKNRYTFFLKCSQKSVSVGDFNNLITRFVLRMNFLTYKKKKSGGVFWQPINLKCLNNFFTFFVSLDFVKVNNSGNSLRFFSYAIRLHYTNCK